MKLSFVLRLKIISDVTDRNRPTIFFGKRWKPRICPSELFDFNSRYLENEKEFFKNSFEIVFRASKSQDRGQLVSAFQLTFNFESCTQKHVIEQRKIETDCFLVKKKSCPSAFLPIRTKNDQSEASIVPGEKK